MRWLPLILVMTLCIALASSESLEMCHNTKEYCDSTNYKSYVECVRKRQKRSIDCQETRECNDNGNCVEVCTNCDCNACNYANCQTSCSNCCNSCCNNYVPCTTNHCCHKTCHAQCNTSTCRSSCRKNCFENVKQNTREVVVIGGGGSKAGNTSLVSESKHNVTTVIHLNNIINHTNIIDIPINLTSTNLQNVSLTEAAAAGINPVVPSGNNPQCCTVIGPKQCISQPKPRCFHIRSQQCGPFCTTSIVHKEQEQVCEMMYPGAPNMCKQQVIYIPQPQPRCAYQAEWPYVRCGVQRTEACSGCYSHYVNAQSTSHLTCPSQCYDDGFSNGPLYRQGPFYRPMYSHMPFGMPMMGGYPMGGDGMGGGFGMSGFGAGGFMPQFSGQAQEMPDLVNLTNDQQMPDGMINVGVQQFYQPQPYRVDRDLEIEIMTEPPSNGGGVQAGKAFKVPLFNRENATVVTEKNISKAEKAP